MKAVDNNRDNKSEHDSEKCGKGMEKINWKEKKTDEKVLSVVGEERQLKGFSNPKKRGIGYVTWKWVVEGRKDLEERKD